MERRNFIKTTMTTAATAGLGMSVFGNTSSGSQSNSAQFNLKYAPALNAFPELAGNDPIEVIKFCKDQGFSAIFDNNLSRKEPALQEKIANELSRQGMELGPFVCRPNKKVSMVYQEKEIKDAWIAGMEEALATAKRTGAKQTLIVPGLVDAKLEMDYQTANVIDNLRIVTEMAEKAGLVIVLEPLNPWNHPGRFLTGIPQAYSVCRAVNSPSCKIVDDFYHQQITEGNLIPNMERAWDEIAAFHVGDNPGRTEPGTGEINYLTIFKHIYDKGYDGILCLEHGKSIKGAAGEKALIEAYRKVDNFL